jgi:phosphoribosylformimino-5-aminoimidazole carboxamide ribotide isomerase
LPFEVIPAIDIKDGKAVRLRQGRADQVTVFDDSPVAVARRFAEAGARRIHVVDLDGAFRGEAVSEPIVREILSAVAGKALVQVGGGIRTFAAAERYVEAGVSRVILGTAVVRDPEATARIASAFPGRVAVGIDAKNGDVAVSGWVESTGVKANDLARAMEAAGVACFVYTDIARDGMMEGPNLEALRDFARGLSTPVIASGGVTTLSDVERLSAMAGEGVAGVVIGRAIYDGSVPLADALRLGRD